MASNIRRLPLYSSNFQPRRMASSRAFCSKFSLGSMPVLMKVSCLYEL